MPVKKTANGRHHSRDPAAHSLHRIAEAVEHIAEHIHEWARDRGEVMSDAERQEIADALSSAKTASDATQAKLRKLIERVPTPAPPAPPTT